MEKVQNSRTWYKWGYSLMSAFFSSGRTYMIKKRWKKKNIESVISWTTCMTLHGLNKKICHLGVLPQQTSFKKEGHTIVTKLMSALQKDLPSNAYDVSTWPLLYVPKILAILSADISLGCMKYFLIKKERKTQVYQRSWQTCKILCMCFKNSSPLK